MTICILGTSEETAQALDNKSLEKMIKDIAKILCNVHYSIASDKFMAGYFALIKKEMENNKIPLPPIEFSPNKNCEWSQWGRECLANYQYLFELGLACCEEFTYRLVHPNPKNLFDRIPIQHKSKSVIEWARDNVPDLPEYEIIEVGRDEYGDCVTDQIQLDMTPLPLVMPKKYHTTKSICLIKAKEGESINLTESCEIIKNTIKSSDLMKLNEIDTIESYQNYYRAILNKNLKRQHEPKILPSWTRREKPEWINL